MMFKERFTHSPEIVGGGTKTDLQKKGGCYQKRIVSSVGAERKEVNAY